MGEDLPLQFKSTVSVTWKGQGLYKKRICAFPKDNVQEKCSISKMGSF